MKCKTEDVNEADAGLYSVTPVTPEKDGSGL
jgi:hypothetical protein